MIVPNLTEEMVDTILSNAPDNLDMYLYEDSWLNTFLQDMGYNPHDSRLALPAIKFITDNPDEPSATDFDNAVILYEALEKDVAPFVAASGAFWNAMIHANLEYMRYRWPLEDPDREPLDILAERYLMNWVPSRRERERNGLSRLWWIVYLTVDDDPGLPDRYALTREVMSLQDTMTNILDREQFNPQLTRCFAKVLYKEHEAGRKLNRPEIRALMKHVFALDRVILLYSLTEEQIIEKLTDYLNWYRMTAGTPNVRASVALTST